MLDSYHFHEFVEFSESSWLVVFFRSSQPHHHIYVVAFSEELIHLLRFYEEVVFGRAHAYLNLLEFGSFLRQTRLLFRFTLHIPVLVKTHQAGHRRLRIGRYLDQVDTLAVFYEFQRFFPGQYADVFTVGSYDPDFGRGYFVVDSRFYGITCPLHNFYARD